MDIPLHVEKISWTGGNVSRLAVQGQQAALQLLERDSSTMSHFIHDVNLGLDPDGQRVVVGLRHQVQIFTGQPLTATDITGDFELLFQFTVENLPELLVPPVAPETVPGLHPQLALLLVSVAYSTARGILSVRLQGTPLEGVNLPLVDPRQLLVPDAPTAG